MIGIMRDFSVFLFGIVIRTEISGVSIFVVICYHCRSQHGLAAQLDRRFVWFACCSYVIFMLCVSCCFNSAQQAIVFRTFRWQCGFAIASCSGAAWSPGPGRSVATVLYSSYVHSDREVCTTRRHAGRQLQSFFEDEIDFSLLGGERRMAQKGSNDLISTLTLKNGSCFRSLFKRYGILGNWEACSGRLNLCRVDLSKY